MKSKNNKNVMSRLPIPSSLIERRIHFIHGQEVILDSDLADLYQVPTKVLNQAIKRNKYRFPNDFMFRLTAKEASSLRSQFVTLEKGRGRYSKYSPLAFTEHGVAMLSSVLNSKRAIQMNIFIIRAFIELRKMLENHQKLSKRLQKVEGRIILYDQVLTGMMEDIKRFKNPPKTNAIGFEWRPKSKKITSQK
jgi:ORF6N domain